MSCITWSTWRSHWCLHKALCKAFISIICRMHTIYTLILRVLIIAAILCIVALKLCNGKTIPIKTTYERPLFFDCTTCNCCSNHCGHRWFELHENDENTQCASYAYQRHICACPKVYNMCISFPGEALKHTFEKYASEPYQTMRYWICDLLCLSKCASSDSITLGSDVF